LTSNSVTPLKIVVRGDEQLTVDLDTDPEAVEQLGSKLAVKGPTLSSWGPSA
jgi:hypothetical protein